MKKISILSILFLAILTVSCLNDGLSETKNAEGMVAELADQALSIESTIAELDAVISSIESEEEKAELTEVSNELADHVAYLKSGASWLNGTSATLQKQKALATAVSDVEEMPALKQLDKRAAEWIGEDFSNYYKVAKAVAKADAMTSSLNSGMLVIEGLESDVEAGLRKELDADALSSLSNSAEENNIRLAELSSKLGAMDAELEDGYMKAIEAAVTSSDVNLAVLDELNDNAKVVLKSAGTSLADLSERVGDLEDRIEDILAKLEKIEADIDELLGMIQSVTFMSEFAENKAGAEYALDFSNFTEDGCMKRKPASSAHLKFIIRPAAAAAALAERTLWNNEIKMIGYYAVPITKASPALRDFSIEGVTLEDNGIVSVSIKNDFSEEFFFKKTGAKLAISITTSKTDMTSEFIEIVPKDQSSDVYVEELELSAKTLEIDNGQSAKLTAYLNPENATESSVVWSSSNNNVVTVSSNGEISAKSVGEATITATTKGIDEWGKKLTAQCNVKVIPSIRITGPAYVEQGGEIKLEIESPDYINPELITWSISGVQYQAYASVTAENGVATVYGKGMWFEDKMYKTIPVTCTIAGGQTIVLTHDIRVIAKQPKGIAVEGLAYDQNQITIKNGSKYTFNTTLEPGGINMNYFRIRYQSAQPECATVDFESGAVSAVKPGTAFIDISVLDEGGLNYFYPAREKMVRQIAVVVEPYWVKTLTLPETITLEPDPNVTTNIPPVFTSDVTGQQPDDMTLVWTSSAPEIVYVDETTGALTALKEGSAQITATTAGTLSVPEGSAQISASCIVTVETPTDPVNIGDYYYSDGTWSTELISGKTVIGVVFSKSNAVVADPALLRDHPECSHGLVVSLIEYTDKEFGSVSVYSGHSNYANAGFDANAIVAKDKVNGYGNTLAHKAIIEDGSIFNSSNTSVINGKKPNTPSSSSGWYIPSYLEMKQLNENREVVNAAISAKGGTPIAEPYANEQNGDNLRNSDWYWTSTIYGTWFERGKSWDHSSYPFDISRNDWTTYVQAGAKCKVRLVLAF